MDDLFQSILDGAAEEPESGEQGGDPLSGLLGGLLGGSSEGAAGGGDLLEAILGGGQGAGGGLGGILGGLLGGGAAGGQAPAAGAGSFLAPVVSGLAENMGLPPQIAQVVVGFLLNKLMGGISGGGGAPAASSTGSQPAAQEPAGPQGLSLDQVLEQMGSGQGPDLGFTRSSGMAEELAQQTGLDAGTAAASLEEAMTLLTNQLGNS
jgi:hypothetical protein